MTIQSNTNIPFRGDITIFDLFGLKVKEFTGKGENQQLDIRDLPAGTYFIHMTDGESRYSRKLMVIK